MRKVSKIALLCLAAITCSAHAEGDDVKLSGAFKIWAAQFKTHNGDTSATNSTGNLSMTASKNDVFVTFSTLLPASYNFDQSGTYMKRSDTDIAVGWRVSQPIALVLGHKNLSYSGNVDNSTGNMLTTYAGLSGFLPLNEKSYVYGTGLLSLSSKDTGLDTTKYDQTNHFNSLEFGYAYYFTNTTQFTAGYRLQTIKSSLLNGSSETDRIGGVIFGANVNFN